jgi:hypothetical protein
VDDANEPLPPHPATAELTRTRAATCRLDHIDRGEPGLADYSGSLLSDVDFTAFSRSALVRIADEVCLQMHLLSLGFRAAVRRRADSAEQAEDIARRALTGHAGIAAERLSRALDVRDPLRVLALHPLLNPAAYVTADVGSDRAPSGLRVSRSPAHEDRAWIALCGPEQPAPLQAAVRAVDPRLDVELLGTDTDWSLTVVQRDEPAAELDEVVLARFSTGTTFEFQPRRSIPLTVL